MDTEQDYIAKLNALLNEYRFSDKILSLVLSLIIMVVVLSVWLLVQHYIILLVIVFAVAGIAMRYGITVKRPPIPEGKLAYEVCLIMEALVDLKNNPNREYRILKVGTGQHKKLYKEFIELYPHIASRKLKRLSSVSVQSKDI